MKSPVIEQGRWGPARPTSAEPSSHQPPKRGQTKAKLDQARKEDHIGASEKKEQTSPYFSKMPKVLIYGTNLI